MAQVKLGGSFQHTPGRVEVGATVGVGRYAFLGTRVGTGFVRASELTSPRPNYAALAPIWTLRDFAIRMTLMCLCLSVTLLHPLRSKEKLSDMF